MSPNLEPVADAHGAFPVVNPAPERGQFSSIQIGLRDVLNRGRDAAFLVPVDRPPVLPGNGSGDLRAAFLAADTDVWAVVPEVLREAAPVHGHPILIGREMMEQFLRAPATAVARDIEHQHQQHIRYVPVADDAYRRQHRHPGRLRAPLARRTIPAETTLLTSADMPDPASQFIDSVLALRPEIAVFDCDGTLWSGDAGRDFFYWEIERGLVSREVADAMLERYRLYEVGRSRRRADVRRDGHHASAAFRSMTCTRRRKNSFVEVVAPRIFPEMQELTHRLAEQGCDLWAVSSTNNWVVEAGASRFGFARDHVLAAWFTRRRPRHRPPSPRAHR